MLCLWSETYWSYDVTPNEIKFNSKSLNKRVLEQIGEGPVEKYGEAWKKKQTSFRTIEDSKQTIILLLLMNKSKQVCLTFTQTE